MENKLSQLQQRRRKQFPPFLLVCFVLMGAFAIRVANVWFGYPLALHPDEQFLVGPALAMDRTGDLNPHMFLYPSLLIYLQALVFKIVALVARISGFPHWPLQAIDYFICGRILNVIFSTLTIYVVYEIGKRLFNAWAALAAVCFISASSLHVTNSFYATVDTSTAFWSSMACLTAVEIHTKGARRRFYILGGISVGLAISSKYTAFPAYLPILVAHLHQARQDKNWVGGNVVLSLICVPAAFLITTPYAILDSKTFVDFIVLLRNAYSSGMPGAKSLTSTSIIPNCHILFAEGYGKMPTLLAVAGGLCLCLKKTSKALLLLSFPVALFVLFGSYKTYFGRNLVPIIPFLSLLSGYSIYLSFELLRLSLLRLGHPRGQTIVASSLSVLLICGSLLGQMEVDCSMTKRNALPDTRWVSLQWIQGNIPPGAIIGREHYTPPIEDYSDKYTVAFEAYFAVLTRNESLRTLDYMIVSGDDYVRFVDHADQYPAEAQIYNQFFSTNELIKEFPSDDKTITGPTIRIYKIKH
jgi:4-amino-4-deoxy-L-arabinose transferase-like glycosyltransferase